MLINYLSLGRITIHHNRVDNNELYMARFGLRETFLAGDV